MFDQLTGFNHELDCINPTGSRGGWPSVNNTAKIWFLVLVKAAQSHHLTDCCVARLQI